MNVDLAGLPFDHYQRYAAAAQLVRALGDRAQSVVEVGANRQRLLGAFLPSHRLLYTDIEPQEDATDFVVADARALPFADGSCDAVVSLDVLEHVPPAARSTAVAEMARVAARLVVICCPVERPWVREAEAAADGVWRRYFGQSYPWLAEHQEHGLVDPLEVEQSLVQAGLQVRRFGQGDASLWAALMGAHFAKEVLPELKPLVAAADRYYNAAVFPSDRSDRPYREVFIGVRHQEDVELLRSALDVAGRAGNAGSEMLVSIGSNLGPVIDRVLHAEKEWKATADMLFRVQAELERVSSLQQQLQQDLQASQQRADTAEAGLARARSELASMQRDGQHRSRKRWLALSVGAFVVGSLAAILLAKR